MNKMLMLVALLTSFITVTGQEWETDLSVAKRIAAEKNRNIVLVFSGSDWCAPCIKLEKEIWETDEFKSYAKEHFVMLRADFPRKKVNRLSKEQQEKNNKLAETYNLNGYFPFVLVLDANGKILVTTDYKKVSPKEYISILTSI